MVIKNYSIKNIINTMDNCLKRIDYLCKINAGQLENNEINRLIENEKNMLIIRYTDELNKLYSFAENYCMSLEREFNRDKIPESPEETSIKMIDGIFDEIQAINSESCINQESLNTLERNTQQKWRIADNINQNIIRGEDDQRTKIENEIRNTQINIRKIHKFNQLDYDNSKSIYLYQTQNNTISSNKKCHILIVDNDLKLAKSLGQIISNEENMVDVADCGSLAIDKASLVNYTHVILDYALGDMKGDEVARRLRTYSPGLTLILLTGFRSAVPNDSLSLFDYIFEKPVQPIDIIKMLRYVPIYPK